VKEKKGYIKVVTQEGQKGVSPKNGQEVTVHYTGTLPNGKIFDSSKRAGKPFSFLLGLGQVIQGWDVGVATMTKGEHATLYISSDYGYGDGGHPPAIPPKSPLIFDVELIDFKDVEIMKTGTNFL
jgi:FKBP-type peptidyl-prolyl cis-trans isomerase